MYEESEWIRCQNGKYQKATSNTKLKAIVTFTKTTSIAIAPALGLFGFTFSCV